MKMLLSRWSNSIFIQDSMINFSHFRQFISIAANTGLFIYSSNILVYGYDEECFYPDGVTLYLVYALRYLFSTTSTHH